MEKRYQVFISSTYEDLQEERRAVSDTLLSLDCIPIGMEEFPATDEEQFGFIKKIIDESDYYLLIIGGRYGSVCEDGISFTEKEFDYAVSAKKTVLSFIYADRDSLPCNKTDRDDSKKEKLNSFIEKVSTNRLKKDWHNKDELKYLVSQSISYAKKTKPAIGYIRAEVGTNIEELLKQLNELRIENAKLKSKLAKKEYNKKGVSDVAGLDEEYDFLGMEHTGAGGKLEKRISASWVDLFLSLAPASMEGIDDENAKHLLNKFFSDKANIKSFMLSDDSFYQIKIQFIALELFDEDGFWQLTEKGKRCLLENSAIRTKHNSQDIQG